MLTIILKGTPIMSNTAAKSASFHIFSTKELVLCGIFAALIAVVSQLSIPLPTGVPVTVQIFIIALTGTILGSRLGFTSALVFILAGIIGIPVFSNFRGGIHILTGVTGGYLWSYPFMAALCGISPKTQSRTKQLVLQLIFATMGLILSESLGGLQWAALAGDKTIGAIFTYSMLVFVPKDFALTITAVLIGNRIKKSLVRGAIL